MKKRLLSSLNSSFLDGLGRRLWLQKLKGLLGICFVVFSPSHSSALPLTKEQSVLENRIEIVRDKLLKQDKSTQDNADSDLIAQWYNWNNWPNWSNWRNF
ncbi:hypothetical protein CRENPOLYSF2_2440016 [Crenothrix polyspora]|uniref:Uncharacterized protein n=1 Tax=Crenothrix polyspora TaxID=360316 RepID=A0A1R4H7E6_9GAMM|nr:hypothetical protein [Crenothrix polyspora]SJM91951.1 hypothetical protein CRENPOLYSF2_2440016 [Crenothrix polyspora]